MLVILLFILALFAIKCAWSHHYTRSIGTFDIEKEDILARSRYLKSKLLVSPEDIIKAMQIIIISGNLTSDARIAHDQNGKGFSTYDSVVRAAEVFGYCSFTVVSQHFHNERAIFLAEHLGLDTHDVIGFNAVSPKTIMSRKTYAREYLARVKVFVDIFYRKIRKTSV